jgi:membrane-bound lytic murein transglycosylase D
MGLSAGVGRKALLLALALLLVTAFNLRAATSKNITNQEAGLEDLSFSQRFQAQPHFLPELPKRVTLCGEKIPLDEVFIAEQLDREFNISVHDRAQVVMWLKRARRYFPFISKQLKKAGLPDDLKYLAVAESALLRKISSHAGAVGLWQFVRRTGTRYGLKRNRWFDDRRNPRKATEAAIKYLTALHKEFKDWPLAMAAYNCGERRVRQAIKEQGTRNYFHLYLPRETMRYVYRIIAAKIILSDPLRYGYDLPESRLYKPWPSKVIKLRFRKTTHLRQLAKAAGTSVRILKELNPELRTLYLPKGTYNVRVPQGVKPGLAAQFNAAQIKQAKANGTYNTNGNNGNSNGNSNGARQKKWVVKPGDTLSKIAKRTGVTIKNLREANGIKGSVIKLGQKLVIPANGTR